MAAVDTEEPKIHPQNLRRKRKKERLIKQGYRRLERDDARRVAARAFLLGIPLDRHLQRRTGATTSETSIAPRSPGPLSVSSKQSRNMLGEGTSVQTGPSVSELSGRLQDMLDTLPQRNPSPSKGLERQFDTPIPPYPLLASRSLLSFDSHELMQTPAHRRQQYGHTKWHTVASEPSTPGVHVHVQYGFPPLELLGSSRLVFVARRLHGCTPFAIHSVLPYNKFRMEYTRPRERTRARTTSLSLQLELDGIELGDSNTDVSLAFLLAPLWGATEFTQLEHGDNPTPVRRQSSRRSKKLSLSLSHHPTIHPISEPLGSSFPWQNFRECHNPTYVLLHYHPLCLDNYEYFVGRNTTTLTPRGYRVSIIQYARDSDVKRGINEQFSEMFPHIKLTLSKLRSIKQQMHRIIAECELDVVAVAHSYVYYEKLVLMGKVNKPNRKLVAGACLLLAAKVHTDIKKQEIKLLIDSITDGFRISTKELLLYELPVLAALQFSLVTPTHQVEAHYDRLRELDQN